MELFSESGYFNVIHSIYPNNIESQDEVGRYKFIFVKLIGGIITFGDESLNPIFVLNFYKKL